MKQFKTLFLMLIAMALLLAACSSAPPPQGASEPPPPPNEPADEEPEDDAKTATIDIVIEALQNPDDWVVIDVRTAEEFSGESRLPNAFGSGRLKGAVNVDRELAFDSDGELLAREELLELYDFVGDKKVIVYCHGGARSAIIWEVLTELGIDALHYSGSWVDWSWAASVANDDPSELVLSLTEEWTDNEGVIE